MCVNRLRIVYLIGLLSVVSFFLIGCFESVNKKVTPGALQQEHVRNSKPDQDAPIAQTEEQATDKAIEVMPTPVQTKTEAVRQAATTPVTETSEVAKQTVVAKVANISKVVAVGDAGAKPVWSAHCAWSEAEVEESWMIAVQKAKAAFEKFSSKIQEKDLAVVINYDTLVYDPNTEAIHGDRMRVYDVSQGWSLVRREWVSHAYESGPNCLQRFSNVPNSLTSSRGAFITHKRPHHSPSFGYPALKVHGLESGINDRALNRSIIFHKSISGGMTIDYSHGCFMTRPAVNRSLLPQIAGGRFVYVYSSASDNAPARNGPDTGPSRPQEIEPLEIFGSPTK